MIYDIFKIFKNIADKYKIDDLKKTWKNLRDTYNNYKKKLEKGKKITWELFDLMSFLDEIDHTLNENEENPPEGNYSKYNNTLLCHENKECIRLRVIIVRAEA